MATEAEKSAVDQGHTAESSIAPPPAPAAAVAVAAPPLLPPAPPVVVAPSVVPVPLSLTPPPSLPHKVPVSGAPVPVASPSLVAQPPALAVSGGPVLGTAVVAGPDSAHLVAPSAAPVNPVAQRLAESQIRAPVGGNAAAHRGQGSPRRRPSSSYRSAHRGGRGGWSRPRPLLHLHCTHLRTHGLLLEAMIVLLPPAVVLCLRRSIRPCPGFPLFRTWDLWEREAEGRGGPSFPRVAMRMLRPCSLRPLFPYCLPR
ncbi:unnamed protein product [Closterium sp. NIES-65]|nr:unnamed protein product [Closterium sp. NIES-65]